MRTFPSSDRFLGQPDQAQRLDRALNKFRAVAGCFLLAVALATGCKPKPAVSLGHPGDYFKTPFQNESQFIVEAVVTDLAEQMVYAGTHRMPEPGTIVVSAREQHGLPQDPLVYKLEIALDPKQKAMQYRLEISGPIWSPGVYQGVVAAMAQAVGLNAPGASPGADKKLLAKLTDNSAETIEQEDQRLSTALESDFGNPELHEQAALLLGAFLLRDHSGEFFEIRTPLSRMTAHLAMAQFLRGTGTPGINGQMADAMLRTLIGNEAPALEQLNAIGTNDTAALPWVRALRALNTGDYRPLDRLEDITPTEWAAWFFARADYVSVADAWPKLSDTQQKSIDFVRAASAEGYSVEIGHQLLASALPLEFAEIDSVYKICRKHELNNNALVQALNETPDRCFSRDNGGSVHVHVIGWGQWALFLQRHLCHAVHENFRFMQYKWGVPDDAKEFAAKCDRSFGGLRLYPFVRRLDCRDLQSYHQSVDDAFKVTVAAPNLVPAECWNRLCYKPDFAPVYRPVSNPHINEWHFHDPPPGTVYDLTPRLNQPALIDRPDAGAALDRLHVLAPYDCRIANYLIWKKYTNCPTCEQATALFGNVLPYSVAALRWVAWTVADKPDQYEKFMLQAAALDPSCYYTLADYAADRQEDDKAAQYLDQAAATDADSVRISNHALWRVRYWVKKGDLEKARQIASAGGEVYSGVGLQAEGTYFEAIHDYDEAFSWYAKDEERYNDSDSLVSFCLRYKQQTGDTRFEGELKKRLNRVFPEGMQTVSLTEFHDAPADGVVFRGQSGLMAAAGLRSGDVVVAVYGIRVHNVPQYNCARSSRDTPELDLIVWQGDAYREIKASPPNHLFGVDLGNYGEPKKP